MAHGQILKYTGNNEELFLKITADSLSADAVVIVPETHNAILLKDGELTNTLSSGSYDLFETKKGFFGGSKKVGTKTVDVIFMSKTAKLKVLWGTRNQFDLRDPLTDIPVKVGANGEFEVQISNPRKAYLELIGATQQYSIDALKDRLLGRMLNEIEPAIAKAMREKSLSYDKFSEFKNDIAQSILPVISKMFENDYGLKLFSFTISKVLIADNDVRAIEQELNRRKADAEREAREAKDKLSAKEIAAEIERLDDKNFERQIRLKELERNDYEKYLEVVKIIGWNNGGQVAATQVVGSFCPKCGAGIPADANFCPKCGEKKAVNNKKVCPKCGRENQLDSAFCAGCGQKL